MVRTHAGERDRLVVRVVDRGPGIPPAQLERVFEPFYRAGTAQSGRRGSGLGLAIARGFIQANGGSLHVESLPGQGATFVFELPLERLRAQTTGEQPDGGADEPPRGTGQRSSTDRPDLAAVASGRARGRAASGL